MFKQLACAAIAMLAFNCRPSEANPIHVPPTKDGPRETAMLGAGCFWGVETWMEMAPGVADVVVGYAGGKRTDVKYEDVTTGTSGHAETVKIIFDPTVISYEDLLSKWFFKMHDPTTKDRQGNDTGSQYRSVIFPQSKAQAQVAAKVMAQVEKSGAWKRPLSTTIEPNAKFVVAEDYHQDYLKKHPGGYDNHFLRDLKW